MSGKNDLFHREDANIYATAKTANNDWYTSDLTPKFPGSWILTVGLDTATILTIQMTDGTTSDTIRLNSGLALAAEELYQFEFAVRPGLAYNIQCDQNATVVTCQIDELPGGSEGGGPQGNALTATISGSMSATLLAGSANIGAVTFATNATIGLNAGSNTIGKLAANSGVDIGDVDVTSVPADPFGVNTDAAVAAGASGSMQAKFRRLTSDLDAVKTAVELIDNAVSGSELQVDVVAALPAGSNAIGKLAANSGVDIGDVDVTSMPADPFGANADAAVAAGDAGSMQAKFRRLTTDLDAVKTAVELLDNAVSGSELQVDVVAALPAGTNAIGKLAANSGVDIGDVDVTSVPADPFGANADAAVAAGAVGSIQAKLRRLTTDLDSVKTAVELLDNAISGSEMQVDVVAALPAGSNAIGKLAANSGVDIGDVDVTSVPADPFGANADAAVAAGDAGSIQAKLRRLTTDIDAVKTAVELIDNAISGSEMQVDVVASLPAGTNAIGKLAANDGVDIGDVDVAGLPSPRSKKIDLTTQTAAYAVGDALIAATTFSNLPRTSGQGVIVTDLACIDNMGSASETPTLRVVFFASSVSSGPAINATATAAAGAVYNDNDLDNIISIQTIDTWSQLGQDAIGTCKDGPFVLPAPSSGVDYGIQVFTDTALTAAAARDMTLRFNADAS